MNRPAIHRWNPFLTVLAYAWAIMGIGAAGSLAADFKAPPPTLSDVAYGLHERNVLDLWQAASEKPTPLVVYIHGGGFVNGDKSKLRESSAVQRVLDQGISIASINYRFRDQAPIQDILRDAARAVQFIRSRAEPWNIDPRRIAAYGSSAGAGTSLWLAFHDDLADPDAEDPVLRQSSRIAAAGSLNGQASYDLRDWTALFGELPFANERRDRLAFYGFASAAESETPEAAQIMQDCSMLSLISRDDPPVVVACSVPGGQPLNRSHYLHHPKHSLTIAERCMEHGVTCLLLLRDETKTERQSHDKEVLSFLIKQLKP